MIRQAFYMLLALMLIAAGVGAVAYLFILAINSGSAVGGAVIATGATLGGAWLVATLESRRAMHAVRREEMGKLYLDLAAILAGHEMRPQKLEKLILDYNRKSLLYSSGKAVKAYKTWHKLLTPQGNGEWTANETIENSVRYEAFVKAMRRDLGISNWGLQDGDLARTVISDYDEIEAKARAENKV